MGDAMDDIAGRPNYKTEDEDDSHDATERKSTEGPYKLFIDGRPFDEAMRELIGDLWDNCDT